MYENLTIIRLSTDYNFKNFDCGDTDLNDFFLNDSLNYQNQLLAVTYFYFGTLKYDDFIVFLIILFDEYF
jgi:hypothetical protein